MLTNFQIEDLCQRMKIPLARVCFKDELPRVLELNKTYIINLQDSDTDDGQPNVGSHWTALQINKENDKLCPIYFDSYGAPPPEIVKKVVKRMTGMKHVPHTNKDIQSLMNNACGWYCCAFAYWVNTVRFKSDSIYDSADSFLSLFDDLNKSIDWKKNEYILKHFFRSSDPKLRTKINVDEIVEDDTGRPDIARIPVEVKMVGK